MQNAERIIACCFGGQGKLIIPTPLHSFSILLESKISICQGFFFLICQLPKCWAGRHLERNYVGRNVKYNS